MTLRASDLHLPAGSTAAGSVAVDVQPGRAGWAHSGLQVLALDDDGQAELATAGRETLVVPLTGGCTVEVDGQVVELAGRSGVFAGATDSVYVPRDAAATLRARGGGRFALATARCDATRPAAYLPARDVPVEMRGAGRSSRQVHNLGTPDVLDADRLIVCEVLTPAGNWSSWPPHKHDQDRPGESVLEEIYYFEVAPGPGGPGMGYQRVYGHESADVDVLAEVRTGDVVLVPFGWHGPSMATDGYDLYYLNVMAGPGERAWRICDDPAHAWVRESWAHQLTDPRLPLGGPPGRGGVGT